MVLLAAWKGGKTIFYVSVKYLDNFDNIFSQSFHVSSAVTCSKPPELLAIHGIQGYAFVPSAGCKRQLPDIQIQLSDHDGDDTIDVIEPWVAVSNLNNPQWKQKWFVASTKLKQWEKRTIFAH